MLGAESPVVTNNWFPNCLNPTDQLCYQANAIGSKTLVL